MTAENPGSGPRLGAALTWRQVVALDHDDARAHVVHKFVRHQTTRGRIVAYIAVTLLAMAATAVLLDPFTGPCVTLGAAGWAATRRDIRHVSWAESQIGDIAPPTGRLHVILVMLTATPTGQCSRELFTRLLNQAPDELTCGNLGRHLKGFCPHSAVTDW